MIRPTKYMDLDSSVLNVAANLLLEMKTHPAVSLDELHGIVLTRMGEPASVNFLPALTLLYAVGKVDYDDTADAIYLLKRTFG